MIEIGKNFLSGLARVQQSYRTQKQKYQLLAGQAAQQAEDLRHTHEDKMNYLFRSSSEKLREAYAQARAALAARQATRAAHGISEASGSSVEDKQTVQLNQNLQARRAQQDLQNAAAQQEKTFKEKWAALWQAVKQYRVKSRKNGRWGSVGQAVTSLFK